MSGTTIWVELEPYEARALARAATLLLELCHKDLEEFHREVGTHPLEATVMKLQTALICEREAM